jgi:hypothetical protein
MTRPSRSSAVHHSGHIADRAARPLWVATSVATALVLVACSVVGSAPARAQESSIAFTAREGTWISLDVATGEGARVVENENRGDAK